MSKQSTSHDLNTAVPADTKPLDSLSAHIVRLYFDEPFWSHVIRAVDMHPDPSCPTAGVWTTAEGPRMVWNPKWMGSLTDKQVKGLLKHEAMHLVLSHTTSRRFTPHNVHNWAADLAINSDIPLAELPEDGLYPGRPFKPLTPEDEARMGAERVKRHLMLSAFIAALPKGESTEWYFARLMENPDVSDAIENGGGESGYDVHDGWAEGLTEEERELAKAAVERVVRDAVKEADRTGRWGSVPAEMRAEIRSSLERTVDWAAVLRQFCGQSQRADRRSSWNRLNKRYPGAAPGSKRSYTATVAVYVDQSGSVGNEELERAFGELAGLADRVRFVSYHFDTEVDEKSRTEWKRGARVEARRTRAGGTDFSAPIKHANARKSEFDGIIIVTDGQAPKPPRSDMRCCWLLVPGTDLAFRAPQGHIVVKMDRAKRSAA